MSCGFLVGIALNPSLQSGVYNSITAFHEAIKLTLVPNSIYSI